MYDEDLQGHWPERGVRFAKIWVCSEPDGNGDAGSMELVSPLSLCNTCEANTFYCRRHGALQHLKEVHGIPKKEREEWLLEMDLDLSKFWRRRWARCGVSASRIRFWSFGCFVESAPLRTILRTSGVYKGMFPGAEKHIHDASRLSARWERTVLQDWVRRGIDKYRSNIYAESDLERDGDGSVTEESSRLAGDDNGSNLHAQS